MESGGFGKAPRGKIDKAFDAASVSPGVNIFEKMISGAYIGPLCLVTAQAAAKAGLFSSRGRRAAGGHFRGDQQGHQQLPEPPRGRRQSRCRWPWPACRRTTSSTLYYLVDALVERAAKLTAINLSSVALKSGKGFNPCRPICIVAEGTTFYRLKSLRQKIEYYLKQYLVDKKHVYYEIVNVENATLIGAAIAGLTN